MGFLLTIDYYALSIVSRPPLSTPCCPSTDSAERPQCSVCCPWLVAAFRQRNPGMSDRNGALDVNGTSSLEMDLFKGYGYGVPARVAFRVWILKIKNDLMVCIQSDQPGVCATVRHGEVNKY
jgi:hypothetical protein